MRSQLNELENLHYATVLHPLDEWEKHQIQPACDAPKNNGQPDIKKARQKMDEPIDTQLDAIRNKYGFVYN